jgi:hypothetical protein
MLGGMDLQEADLVVLGVEGMILVGFFGAAGRGQIGRFGWSLLEIWWCWILR